MMKKLIGSGLVAVMMLSSVLSAFPATAASDPLVYGDFEYTDRNSYAEINAYNGTDTTVEIPSEINGLKVKEIAADGLCGNKFVEKYIIPEGITTIGQYALSQNTNLKEISFPSTLKSVQRSAISYDKSLEVVNFPEGLETIEGCVLYTCYSLTDVYIPSTVTSIGEDMFCSCSFGLEEFYVDENNDSYCSVDGVLFTKDQTRLIRYPLHKSGAEYEIPSTVTEIAPSAFDTVTTLEKLEIPDNVKTIGERAFSMSTLKELRLPHELTVLPQYCIGSMHKLEKLYIPKSLTTIGNVACTFFDVIPTIYYEGTEDDWNSIEIGSMNADFGSLDFVYNYDYSSDISELLLGDVNADGEFNVADVVILQKWLLAVPNTELVNWKAADLCEDDRLDVFDLCLMKRALIEQNIFQWDGGEDSEKNRISAKTLGNYALEKLKDGTFSLDTVIDSENASALMDEETAALMDKYVFTSMEFMDEHTVMLHLNYGLQSDYGYLITDGTVSFEAGTQVPISDSSYDGGVINIEWADGNLYYFSAGL